MISLAEETYKDGTRVQHPIIVISGTVSKQLADNVVVHNETSSTSFNWPVVEREFKVLVCLKPGANLISLMHGFYSKQLRYTLLVRQSPYLVQPLYIISKDGDGCYQSPLGVDNSSSSAVRKISLGAALLQTFTASNLAAQGFGQRTFQLPLDVESGLPLCTLFRSKFKTAEIFAMTEKELWRSIARELMESADIPNRYTSKFLAFLACTRYNGSNWKPSWRHADVLSATQGHSALGGGGLALLGSGTLHSWADSLENLVQCFTDETMIDSSNLMDDSAYRSTYWANYSTGLGAALHELGHTFDLSHTLTGIMSRGFDNMHRFFVLEKARPVKQQERCEVDKLNRLKSQLKILSEQAETVKVDSLSQPLTCTSIKTLTFTAKSAENLETSINAGNCSHKKSAFTSPEFAPCSGLIEGPQTHMLMSAGLSQVSPSAADGRDKCLSTAASSWSPESALMLSTSKWLMHDDEIPCKKSQTLKPVLHPAGYVASASGIFMSLCDAIQLDSTDQVAPLFSKLVSDM